MCLKQVGNFQSALYNLKQHLQNFWPLGGSKQTAKLWAVKHSCELKDAL